MLHILFQNAVKCSSRLQRSGWQKWFEEAGGQNGWPRASSRAPLLGGASHNEDSDEEDVIYITDQDRELEFKSSDARNAKKVQEKFGLDFEPAHLWTKKDKKVNFEQLKDGVTYKLPKKRRIPNQMIHLQNAAFMSLATYKQDSELRSYLELTGTKHSIHTICGISKHSPQKVVLAVGTVADEETLYVAFRGSVTKDDWLADINIKRTSRPNMAGLFHEGFSGRSKTVSVGHLLQCARNFNCKTIITCGHSLGGAVSSVVALDLMKRLEESKDTTTKAHNITFGAPAFGNKDVLKMCKDSLMDKRILNYTNIKDVVPGILNLEHTATVLKDTKIDFAGSLTIMPVFKPALSIKMNGANNTSKTDVAPWS